MKQGQHIAQGEQAPAVNTATGPAVQPVVYAPAYAPVQQPQTSDWKSAVKVVTLGAATLGISFWLVRKLIYNAQTNREENKTMSVDEAATKAKQLKMAFDNDGWPGTDEIAIREVFRSLKNRQEYDEIVKSYKNNYHRNLNQDLASELTSAEYNEMLYILATKPGRPDEEKPVSQFDAWARRLRSAISEYYIGFWPSTDEDAIYAVFDEIPHYPAYQKTEQAYKRIYGTSLYSDLCGDMWQSEVDELIKKVKSKH